MILKRRLLILSVLLLSAFVSTTFDETGATEKVNDIESMVLDFSRDDDKTSWRIVNDGVMGGISQSEIVFGGDDQLIFRGTVSLANNGGFASLRRAGASYHLGGYSGLLLQVRGDGKHYQLRVRTDNRFDGISYRYRFQTKAGVTQAIEAPFSDFEPVFRGRIIADAAPLAAEKIQQIGFLIADKQAGQFTLEIDWIKRLK